MMPQSHAAPAAPSVDKRQLHRVPCRIVVTRAERSAPLGEIRNLSLDGMFVATPEPLPCGVVVTVAFPLGDDPVELVARAEVVHRGERGMGLRFLRLPPRSARRLRRFVVEATSAVGHRAAAARLRDAASRTEEAVRGREAVERLLRASAAAGAVHTLVPAERAVRERGVLASVGPDVLRFRLERPSRLAPDENVAVLHALDFVSYSFEARVRSVSGLDVELDAPTALQFSERRAARRDAAGGTLQVRVPWRDAPQSWPLCELGEQGLSFRADPGSVFLVPGTPLEDAVVVRGGRAEPLASAVVRHLTLVRPDDGGAPWLKVGVAHGVRRAEGAVAVAREDLGATEPTRVLGRLTRWAKGIGSRASYLYHRRFGEMSKGSGAPFEVVRFRQPGGREVVGLLNLTFGARVRAPLVVIVPGYGSRKETMSALAMTLVHNFRREHRDLAVLRFDGTNNLGESGKDAGCERDGQQTLHHTVSGTVDDIRGALAWAHANPYVDPTEVVLVSVSFASIAVRRILSRPEVVGVNHWIALMGAADAQNAVMHAAGNIDAYGNYVRGVPNGPVALLGCVTDGDGFCRDLVENRLGTLEDARREMATVRADVTWIAGRHDALMDLRRVRDVMSVAAPGAREVVEVDAGHVPRSGDEAIAEYLLIARRIFKRLYQRELDAVAPAPGWLAAVSAREWDRVRRPAPADARDYWREYLLADDGVGFDVLAHSPAYQQFVAAQVDLAAPDGRRVLDLGAGTGNVALALLERAPRELVCADLVPEALERLRSKLPPGARVQTRTADADGAAWTALRRWIQGELPGITALAGRVPGLSQGLLERVAALADPELHAATRGAAVDVAAVAARLGLPPASAAVLADLNLAARAVRGLVPPAVAALRRLPPTALDARGLPFADGAFDVVVASLLLSYLSHPADALSEMARVLAPGGTLVVSSLRPDADSAGLFVDLVQHLERLPDADGAGAAERAALLAAARTFANRAVDLMRLEEEGHFRFYAGDELAAMVRAAGFEDVRVVPCFGAPAQAVAVRCRRA